MTVWEIDFYRRPLQDASRNPMWEWVVCSATGKLLEQAFCSQVDVNTEWIVKKLRLLEQSFSTPSQICVFRPQTFNVLDPACQELGLTLLPTRHTSSLKQLLQKLAEKYAQMPEYTRQPYDPIALDQPPPLPLDDNLLGQSWQFAALPAGEIADAFAGRMIPVLDLPEPFLPLKLGLPSTLPIPGVVIEAGRRSLRLAQWIQTAQPFVLNYIPGAPDGLILEAGLVDRWIVATFDDSDVALAASNFESRKQATQGLHFLLIQPDTSGVTYSGFWLLKG